MDWNFVLNEFFKYGMYLLGIVVTGLLAWVGKDYIVPFLKLKLSKEQSDRLESLIKNFIVQAEAKFTDPKTGEIKKEWVFEQLDSWGVDYNKEYISNFIDGMVKVLTAEGVVNT